MNAMNVMGDAFNGLMLGLAAGTGLGIGAWLQRQRRDDFLRNDRRKK